MLLDLWLLSQLLLQICCLFLLAYAVKNGFAIVKNWQPAVADEKQLLLEHKNYLIGAISQLVLVFQVLGLVFFMLTTNSHLPPLLKGAMCANGVLAANEYGFPLLYVKMGSILVYFLFLSCNYLDQQEPAYPLTPQKYWFLFPSFFLLCADTALQVLFYANLNPDRIVTCCSLTFLGEKTTLANLTESHEFTTVVVGVFVGSFVLLNVLGLVNSQYFGSKYFPSFKNLESVLIRLNSARASSPCGVGGSSKPQSIYFQAFIVILYVSSGVFALKHSFVKYIYGLPTHQCLFDTFLPNYNSIGFIIFAAYYGLVGGWLFKMVWVAYKKHLQIVHSYNPTYLEIFLFVCLWLSFGLPVGYWWAWEGSL